MKNTYEILQEAWGEQVDSIYRNSQMVMIGREVNILHMDNESIIAQVPLSYSSGEQCKVEIYFDNIETFEPNDYFCTCNDFKRTKKPCSHIGAAMISLEYLLGNEDNIYGGHYVKPPSVTPNVKTWLDSRPRKTDRIGKEILTRYTSRAIREVQTGTGNGQARLEVTMTIDPKGVFLTFRVGESRLYVIKNIEEFKATFRRSEEFFFGKKYSLLLDRSSFEPGSLPLLRFMLNQHAGIQRDYHYGSREYGKLFLTPYTIDSFFETMAGETITFKSDAGPGVYRVSFENYPTRMSLQRGNGGAVLKRKPHDAILRGRDRIYIFDKDTVYACEENYSAACADVLSFIGSNDDDVYFSDEDIPSFLSSVVRRIKPFILVDLDPNLGELIPPPLATDIYFDLDEVGFITARMMFSYGGDAFPAFEQKEAKTSLDIASEIAMENALKAYLRYRHEDAGTRVATDEAAIYELLAYGMPELSEIATIYVSDGLKKLSVRPPAVVSVGVKTDGRLMTIDFSMEDVDFSELAEILKTYRQAKRYHRLEDGTFLPLEEDAIRQLSELVDGLDLSDKELAAGHVLTDVNRALFVDEMMKRSEELKFERDNAFRNMIRSMHDVGDADFLVPASLTKILRNYQTTGFKWLKTLEYLHLGGILADDMGLGKTLQVLALLLDRKTNGIQQGPSLVVCPSSLVLNWKNECAKFTDALTCLSLIGVATERARLIQRASDYDLIVTSYDQLRRDIDLYDEITFDFVILDEAQYIKNQNTKNSKSVKSVHAGMRLALTGTPVENSLAELWSIFDFLMPGYLYHYARFRKKFELKIVKDGDEVASEQLRAMVRPFILRRMKSEVLKELPEKTETVIYAQMEDTQRKLYLSALALAKEELADQLSAAGSGQQRIKAIAALTRMRQICCDPLLVYENYDGLSAKREACMELIENSIQSEHRILLFSQFTSMIRILERDLKKIGISYFTLEGSTSKTERQSLIDQFNNGDTPIFLISLKAGGTGLNLTSADMVIHYDPWWNISAQNQATDRAHRIGQTNKVQVYKLIAKDTVEEKILAMQARKADIADTIIRENGSGFDTLSREELASLFADME